MAKWVRSLTQDNGLNDVKTNAIAVHLIKAYTLADTYATVISNSLATSSMASGDYTLAGTTTRTLTSATKSGIATTANSGASPNLHFAFTDGSAAVIWVTDETTDQVITSGNTMTFPALVLTMPQPV